MTSEFDLTGRVAIITGAAKGNGQAIAIGLQDAGATVLGVDILPTESENIIQADISSEDGRQTFVETALTRFDQINILVNCAGISIGAKSEDYSQNDWRQTLDVNLDSAFGLCQSVFPAMKSSGGGSIINVTSLGSVFGFPENPAYGAAKGGLRALTKFLARDWGHLNIRVNNLCPGYIRTDMTRASYEAPEKHQERLSHMMLPRWGEPTDLVGPTVFLASDASRYVTGTDLFVDGGWTANGL